MAADYGSFLDQDKAATTPASDPYGALLDEEVKQNQQRTRAVIEMAAKVNPDQAAETQRLSKDTGLAPDVVERNLDEVRRKQQARAIDLVRMAQDSPVLARQLADPAFTTVAQDDLPILSQIEKAVGNATRYMMGAGKSDPVSDLGGAAKTLGLGATVGVGKMAFDIAGAFNDVLGLDGLAATARQSATRAQGAIDEFGMQTESSTGNAVKSGLQSAGTNMAILPLGLARGLFTTANQAATTVTALMGAGVGSAAYNQARDAGKGKSEALAFGIPQGVFEFVFEKIPAQKLFGDLANNAGLMQTLKNQLGLPVSGAGVAGNARRFAGGEIGTEQLTTLAQDFNEWMNLNPEKTIGQFIAERPEAAYQTFIATLVGVGVQTTTIQGINKIIEKASDQSLQFQQDAFADMLKAAGSSALRERSPEQFRELASQMADGATIHVDAQVLNQLPEAVFNQLPESVRAQVADAAAANSTVEIPMADVLTVAPGTPLEQVLNDNARMTPDALSRADAVAAGEQADVLRQDAERVIQQAQDQEAARAEYDTVKQLYVNQIAATGRHRQAVAEQMGDWVASFYTSYGARTGMTPSQFQAKYPLRIVGAPTGSGRERAVLNENPDFFNQEGRLMGINVRSDAAAGMRYADAIVDGSKLYETRNTDSLRPYVGQRVAIVRTGEGKAKAIGEVTIGEPILADEAKFRELQAQHLVPPGSTFDVAPGGQKYLYPMQDAVRYDAERDVGAGIVSRQVLNQASVDRLQMVAERGVRGVASRSMISTEERSAIEASSQATGVPVAEIEAAVRKTKMAHPVAQGWEPLTYNRTVVEGTGEDRKVSHEYKAVSYQFNVDADGKSLEPGTANYKRRVNAVARSMVDEVRTVFRRAADGDANARNILAQAGWYKAMRSRLRKEFGGLGDLFADLLGATSPNTPVRDNWFNAVDALRRASRGDFDTLIVQWEAYFDRVDALETDLRAWFNERLAEGQTKKAIKSLPEYATKVDALRAARLFPDELLPKKESGAKYGFNGRNVARAMVDLWRVVKNADADIGRGGTAPKALNFSGNLIGFRQRATIDVWAARMLQRLAARRRIPSVAETGVSGEMREDGTTTLQFGFGQDVFSKAARDIRSDAELKTDLVLAEVNDDDLQAVVWFIEKEIWTVNNWTSAAGEGGSFELEANLSGTSEQARVKELRSIIDGSPPTADVVAAGQDTGAALKAIEEHELAHAAEIEELRKLETGETPPYKGSKKRMDELGKIARPPVEATRLLGNVERAKARLEVFNARKVAAKAELAGLERAVDRFVGGLSIQMSKDTQGVDFVPTDADMARLAEAVRQAVYERDDGSTVLGSKALSTEGRYGGVERSLDLEVVAREGYDPGALWLEMLRQAQAAKQDSTFLSRVLRNKEDYDPLTHRPGVEIYFRSAASQAQLEKVLADLAKEGVEFLTVIVDGRRLADTMGGAMPAAVGVRLQYVPEFEQRYGMDSLSGLDDAALAAKMEAKAAELSAIADRVSVAVDGVSFAGQFWYETQVAFSSQYQEKIDALTTGVAEEDAAGAPGRQQWAGDSVRAGLAGADRQLRETSSGEPDGGTDPSVGGDAVGTGQNGSLSQTAVGRGADFGDGLSWETTTENLITADIGGGFSIAIFADAEDPAAGAELSILSDDGVDQMTPLRFNTVGEAMQAAPSVLSASSDRRAALNQQAQTPRGTFNPATLELVLNPNANLSTFFHETGHFFLEVMADIASQPNAPAQIVEDWQTFLKWAGASEAEWRAWQDEYARTGKISEGMTRIHERWAESIEQYVMEGKAPSVELQPMMRRFATWLKSVYGSIKQFLASRGQSIAGDALSQTPAPEGVLTDENGRPMVLYHGTQRAPNGIDKFVPAKSGAIFFAESPGYASGWASVGIEQPDGSAFPEQSQVIPAYLQAKNTYDANADPLGVAGYPEADFYKKGVVQKLKRAGYDSASFGGPGNRVFVVFDPKQIVSAISGEVLGQDPAPLTEAQFYRQYLMHKDVRGKLDGTAAQNTESLVRDGFKPGGPGAVNVMPAYQGGEPSNVAEKAYGPRAGDTVYLVPREAVKRDKVVAGWKPKPYEVLQITEDYEALYPLYLRAISGEVLGQYPAAPAGPPMQLNDDIRRVMDRMLATDEQIANANEVAGLVPDVDADAVAAERLNKRSMRDLALSVKARDSVIKGLRKEAKEWQKTIRAEVTAEVDEMPVYLAKDAVERAVAEADADPVAADARLDSIATQYGYTSIDHMAREIENAQPKADVINERTDQRMLEEHGDLIDERAIAQAANEAVHNEARARSLATELRSQDNLLNARTDTGETNKGGARITVNALVEAAKQFGANIVARTTIRDLRSKAWQHTAAERRAGNAWRKSTGAAKTAEAVQAKRDQVLNNAAAKALLEADASVAKLVEYAKKFDKTSVREKLPPEYLDQIDKLLERVDLRVSTTGRQIDRRASLAKWIEAQHAIGLDPVLPDNLLEDIKLKSYKEMTYDELVELVDSIKNIEHLGRLKSKLLAAKDKREFDAIVQEWADSIRANGGKPKPVKLEPDGRIVSFFKGAWADHRKLNSLIRQMDGGEAGGPGFRALIRSMNERGTQEDVGLEKATMALAEIFAPMDKLPGGLSGDKKYIDAIDNSLSRAGRLSIALNWGNTQNRQRVMDGDGWTEDQVNAILATLSTAELQFVNQVWEHIDSYWPDVKAKQLRVSGVVEDKVEAEPFVLASSDGTMVPMRGGYYPIKYDPDRSIRAQINEAKEIAADMLRGAMLRPTTRRGHTKARVEEVKGRPIRKDLAPITQHVSQVVHDLAWHEWAIDANRLLSDPRISAAIRDHHGAEIHRAMTEAVEAIVVGNLAKQTTIDGLLLQMRANVTRSIMGVSATTALLQPFGLTQSMARIGVAPVLKGAARWAGDAAKMESTIEWIYGKSEFMRLRGKTFNRELREINQTIQGKWKVTKVMDAVLFFPMAKMQMIADVPTWVGMYEKSLAEGIDEDTAITLADEAVLSAQGGGGTKDLASVQRNLPFLTQFYSYFSTTLNLVAEKTALTDFKNPRAVAGWAADMALLAMIPAILPALITFALKGGGEDDEPEDWAKRLVEWQASYLLGMFVGLRELPTLWSPFDYGGPPAAKLINDGKRLVQQAGQGEIDDPAVLAAVGFLGTALGIPTTQIIRSYKGWKAWDEGEAPPTSILFGPPPKD